MERVVVVGNCQATALEMMLSTNDAFTARFEFERFPAVHELSAAMVPELHRAVGAAAVVLPQRIDEAYRDHLGLGTETLAELAAANAAVVRWPSLYWAGYVPDLFYLRDAENQPVVDGPFDYHDRAILDAYAQGLDTAAARRTLADPTRPSAAPANAAAATRELDLRGAGCDVDVAPFIAANYRDELLFFTMNHPTNRLLAHVAQAISDVLGVAGRVDHRRIAGEILGPTFYPLHANHVRALELRFAAGLTAGTAAYRIRGATLTAAVATDMFYDYYDAHPDLVEGNLNADED